MLRMLRRVNKVKVGFFSFTEITDPAEHRAYNEWHQLDHMPEQFPIPGIVYGQRWVSTPACRAARAVDDDPLAGDPLHDPVPHGRPDRPDAARLHGGRSAAARAGPLPPEAPRVRSRARSSGCDAHAAPRVLVSAEAVPYRPEPGRVRDRRGAARRCRPRGRGRLDPRPPRATGPTPRAQCPAWPASGSSPRAHGCRAPAWSDGPAPDHCLLPRRRSARGGRRRSRPLLEDRWHDAPGDAPCTPARSRPSSPTSGTGSTSYPPDRITSGRSGRRSSRGRGARA